MKLWENRKNQPKFAKNEVMDLKTRISKGARIYGLLSVLLICTVFLPPAPIARAIETKILLLHTNNVTGYLFPCPT
jgi:NurA-like 5'-3' nuclease